MDKEHDEKVLFEKHKEQEKTKVFWFWMLSIAASIVWLPIFFLLYLKDPSPSRLGNFSLSNFVLEKSNFAEKDISFDRSEEYFFPNQEPQKEEQDTSLRAEDSQKIPILKPLESNQPQINEQGEEGMQHYQPLHLQNADNIQSKLKDVSLEPSQERENSIKQYIPQSEGNELIQSEDIKGE